MLFSSHVPLSHGMHNQGSDGIRVTLQVQRYIIHIQIEFSE